jgi:hypothetical protein
MHDQDSDPNRSKKPEAESLKAEVRGTPHSDAMPEPWVPESKLPKLPARYANSSFISFVRKILLTNPLFPRFYADVVLSSAPNSNEAKILRPQYQKIVRKVNQMSNSKTCTHIKVTGVRCGSPSLYGESFCYFHQHAHRGVRRPPQSRLHPIAILEDEESIQASLMEVINALMRNTIDLKRAELILRALHIAVKNARRAKFATESNSVREIPEYQQPEKKTVDLSPDAPEPELDVPYTAMIPPQDYKEIEAERQRARKAEAERQRVAEIRAKLERAAIGTRTQSPAATAANVGTGVSAGTRVSVGTGVKMGAGVSAGTGALARPASEASAVSATAVKHDYRKQPNATDVNVGAAQRKPVSSTVPAPKERKNAAQRASGG